MLINFVCKALLDSIYFLIILNLHCDSNLKI